MTFVFWLGNVGGGLNAWNVTLKIQGFAASRRFAASVIKRSEKVKSGSPQSSDSRLEVDQPTPRRNLENGEQAERFESFRLRGAESLAFINQDGADSAFSGKRDGFHFAPVKLKRGINAKRRDNLEPCRRG